MAEALGYEGRVSAHSARKGSALEALFAGAPLPVIQAFGGWARADTLQAYLAEGVRRASSVLQIVLGAEGSKGEGGEGKGTFTEGTTLGGGSQEPHWRGARGTEASSYRGCPGFGGGEKHRFLREKVEAEKGGFGAAFLVG